ncbi:MAG: ATP-dependent Clp protease adapter ClpS [Akkermansiaceae bacterium]
MPNTTPATDKKQHAKQQAEMPWNVVVLNDPVNLQGYVTMVFKRVFGYDQTKAEALMMEVHTQGRSVVWSGAREKAELYVAQLHGWQLQTTMEKTA